MSAALFQNNMRLQAQRAMSSKTSSRYGIVTSFNPNNYSAKVQLQPEPNLYTGFLPVATPWAGNGWGMFAPPTAGNQVCVEFIDGDLTAGFVLCPFFNSQMMPIQGSPQPQSGEMWMVHALGQLVKLTNDGRVTISDAHGASLYMDGAGNIVSAANLWTHTGNVVINGNVTGETVTGTTDVVAGTNNISLINHQHFVDGVQTGTSNIASTAPIP